MKRCLHCDRPRVPTVAQGRITPPKGLWCPACRTRGYAAAKRASRAPEHQRPPYQSSTPAPESLPLTVDPIDFPAFLARTREALEKGTTQ